MQYTNRPNICKDIENLNNTINQLNLIAIFRMIYLHTAEHALYSSTRRIFPKMGHLLSHKIILNKFQRIKIIYRKIFKNPCRSFVPRNIGKMLNIILANQIKQYV